MSLIEEIVELGFEHDRLLDQGRLSEADEVYKELQRLREIERRQEE